MIINQKINRKPENQERKADVEDPTVSSKEKKEDPTLSSKEKKEDPTVSSKEKKEDPTRPNVIPKQKGEECKLY